MIQHSSVKPRRDTTTGPDVLSVLKAQQTTSFQAWAWPGMLISTSIHLTNASHVQRITIRRCHPTVTSPNGLPKQSSRAYPRLTFWACNSGVGFLSNDVAGVSRSERPELPGGWSFDLPVAG